MNGFVVTYLGDMDDLPVLFTADKAEAEAKRDELLKHYAGWDEGPDGDSQDDHHPDVDRVLTLMSRDCGSFNGIAVGEFAAGELVGWVITDADTTDLVV